MSIENKQPELNPTTEPSTADDLLTVINVEEHEAAVGDAIREAHRRYQGGEISGEEYEQTVQLGTYNEMEEMRQQRLKQDALDRINGDSPTRRLGRRVVGLFRHK